MEKKNIIATVGAELKNNLSHYLRDVKRGRPVTITERGQSVAFLMPAGNNSDAQLARETKPERNRHMEGRQTQGGSRSMVVKGKPVSKSLLTATLILYVDTSALVKLYVPEPESGAVQQLVESAEIAAVSLVAFAARGASCLARERRERA